MEEEFRSRNQMTTSRNTLQHFAFIEVTLTQEPRASGHSDIHRTKSKVKYFLAWTKKTFFLSIGLDNGQEEKNMGTFIFFLQLFGMAHKLPVAPNTDMRSDALRLFNLQYFISHFVFHSL